jgi:hypothetical protein
MGYRIHENKTDEQFCQEIDVEAINRVVPKEVMEEVIETCGAREQRRRKLPALLIMLLCIAMNIFFELRIGHVMLRLVSGARWLAGKGVGAVAGDSAISEARYRLGVRPFQLLFKRVCRPIATPDTPGAFAFGLRLVAMDGTREDIADTPANEAHFGRPGGEHRSPWPQVHCIYLCECGTHVIFDVFFTRGRSNERKGAYRLLRWITEGMLLMWDSGFYSADLISKAIERGAQVLGRMPGHVKPEVIEVLPDGTCLAYIYPCDPDGHRTGERVLVRVITYTFDDPNQPGYGEIHRLYTTLLDPDLYPALDLIALYHERWEIEVTIDELETHQHLLPRPLRSRKPVGVLQELYAWLIAHFIIRFVMHEAAVAEGIDPDRLSFVHAVRLITEALPAFQFSHPDDFPRLWRGLLDDIAHPRFRLPPRDNRINPRVVKRKSSPFRRKRLSDYDYPQPTKPFRESMVIYACSSP